MMMYLIYLIYLIYEYMEWNGMEWNSNIESNMTCFLSSAL